MYKQGIIIKTNEGKDEGLIYKEDVGTPEGRTGIRFKIWYEVGWIREK